MSVKVAEGKWLSTVGATTICMENLIKNLMVLDDDLNGFHIHAVMKCPS